MHHASSPSTPPHRHHLWDQICRIKSHSPPTSPVHFPSFGEHLFLRSCHISALHQRETDTGFWFRTIRFLEQSRKSVHIHSFRYLMWAPNGYFTLLLSLRAAGAHPTEVKCPWFVSISLNFCNEEIIERARLEGSNQATQRAAATEQLS